MNLWKGECVWQSSEVKTHRAARVNNGCGVFGLSKTFREGATGRSYSMLLHNIHLGHWGIFCCPTKVKNQTRHLPDLYSWIAQMSFSPTFLVHWFLKEFLILCIWYGFYYFCYDKHYWLVLNRLFSSSHPNIYLHFVALGKENEFEEVGVRAHRSWYESEVQSSCPAAWFFPGRWIWFSPTYYLWGTFKPLM